MLIFVIFAMKQKFRAYVSVYPLEYSVELFGLQLIYNIDIKK